jgi:dihydrofolate reductase
MLTLIVAKTNNNCIGVKNSLPWVLKDDMLFFKEKTINNVVVMGRKTFDSLGKPLKNRKNIIITKEQKIINNVYIGNNINDALNLFPDAEVFIIGGEEIYKQTINLVNRMYITEIDANIDGDSFFPSFDENLWDKKLLIIKNKDEKNQYDFKIFQYTRK